MNSNEFDKKVAALLGFAQNSAIEYVPFEMTRKSDWRHNTQGLSRPDGKFFSVRVIEGKFTATGKFYTQQPIVCQQAPQYDKATCDKLIGYIVLPLKKGDDGDILAGITYRNPPGTFGEVVFCAPRGSLTHNDQIQTFVGPKPVYQKLVTLDAARLTGKVDVRVIWADAVQEVQLHEGDVQETVYFTLSELEQLLEHERMLDAPSIALINWLLRNAASIN